MSAGSYTLDTRIANQARALTHSLPNCACPPRSEAGGGAPPCGARRGGALGPPGGAMPPPRVKYPCRRAAGSAPPKAAPRARRARPPKPLGGPQWSLATSSTRLHGRWAHSSRSACSPSAASKYRRLVPVPPSLRT
eukprot:scaffold69163_cov71-Phaeocystis_antarctica.AAC.2